jgi:hypothetical protein
MTIDGTDSPNWPWEKKGYFQLGHLGQKTRCSNWPWEKRKLEIGHLGKRQKTIQLATREEIVKTPLTKLDPLAWPKRPCVSCTQKATLQNVNTQWTMSPT